jgi:hypothetical protein
MGKLCDVAVDFFTKRLPEEWAMVKNAPSLFFLSVAVITSILAVVIWWILKWRYEGIIDNQKQQIDGFKIDLERSQRRISELSQKQEIEGEKVQAPALGDPKFRAESITTSLELAEFYQGVSERMKDVNSSFQEVSNSLGEFEVTLRHNEEIALSQARGLRRGIPLADLGVERQTPEEVRSAQKPFFWATVGLFNTANTLVQFLVG